MLPLGAFELPSPMAPRASAFELNERPATARDGSRRVYCRCDNPQRLISHHGRPRPQEIQERKSVAILASHGGIAGPRVLSEFGQPQAISAKPTAAARLNPSNGSHSGRSARSASSRSSSMPARIRRGE